MEFVSADGEQKYAALAAHAPDLIVALDFDGTLSPIVDDPTQAHIHPDAAEVLTALAERVRAVAVVTGRPARQAVALGALDEIGDALAGSGKELIVFGQYGNERWSTSQRAIVGPRPPKGLSGFLRELPRVLREADATGAYIEDKGLAIAVHTRRLPDAAAAFDRLKGPITRLAERHGLGVEPGRMVVEVRAGGMHKGLVVERLAEELSAGAFLFAGDDLGDVEAFEAVAALAKGGLATLLVCSASDEQSALLPLADVVVPGPDGVLDLLRQLTADAATA